MKLTNIGQFHKISDYVSWKLNEFASEEKSFRTLFKYMFSESENIMAEFSDDYRTKKLTYGKCREMAELKASALKMTLNLPEQSIVGIYMDNSLDWICIFWAVLMCGYRPLLLNLRLADAFLEEVIKRHNVKAVISDKKEFSVKTVMAYSIAATSSAQKPDGAWGDEVIFMSSGTTDNVKLCAYTAENFYYQVGNSVDIVKKCPQIAKHYDGELKILTLLPFYHVFGFIAVYLWFGFFSRTFVFLKNLTPKTIQSTVKRHNVTHIFAVPLVWESVYRAAKRTVRNRGAATYQKFKKGLKLSNSSTLGRRLAYNAMSEIREKLFGDSIKFLISGGGEISRGALEFFNGIGYHLANGYGMTEVGITSVEVSSRASRRNTGSIGAPFVYTHYSLSERGTLLIKGKNMASRIICRDVEARTDFDAWFDSGDLAMFDGEGYYLNGRIDDLIVSESGENLNPGLIEKDMSIPHADDVCLILANGDPVLLIKSSECYSENKIREMLAGAMAELDNKKLRAEIRRIAITPDNFLLPGEIKLNRRKLAARFLNKELTLIDRDTIAETVKVLEGELENNLVTVFAEVLQKNISEIGVNDDFFNDLGGDSLTYFILSDAISDAYGVDIKNVGGVSLTTISSICKHIKEN